MPLPAARLATAPPKLLGTPEMIFRWRPLKSPVFPRLLALAAGVTGLTFVLSLQVQVRAPEKISPRRAAVILLRDDVQGRALRLKAQEGGPFPARFELSQWSGLAEIEAAAMAAARHQPPPYEPTLPELPAANQLRPLTLAAAGKSFFPSRRTPTATPVPDTAELRLTPALYPLAGISPQDLPRDLPPFDHAVDRAMSSAQWRFLLRLAPAGNVMDCVSLEKGAEPSAEPLTAWLRKLQFPAEIGKPARWISLGIGFTNSPTPAP